MIDIIGIQNTLYCVNTGEFRRLSSKDPSLFLVEIDATTDTC